MKSVYLPIIKSWVPLYMLTLTSCGFWKNDDALASQGSSVLPAETATQKAATPFSSAQTWEFTVNPKLTTGTIDLAMDPKGAMLGTRTARDVAALKGKVIVSITEHPVTGERQIAIKDMLLTNTAAYQMDFAWGALVGSISVHIPARVLRILPNQMDQACALESNKLFSLPQSYFTVLGHSHTRGHGLVLSRAVGNKKVDLTMKKTEPVALSGTVKVNNGTATLHVPRAVLRDRFDLDGTKLDLVFTADITATAIVR